MRRDSLLPALLLALMPTAGAGAQDPPPPLHWGEQETLYTTVCEKRWHAARMKTLRNDAIANGAGALQQVKREKEAQFTGRVRCFTGDVTHRPVDHPDIIDGVKSWVRIVDPEGTVPCLGDDTCRWDVRLVRFVESHVELPDGSGGGPVYVATERAIVPGPAPRVPGKAKP